MKLSAPPTSICDWSQSWILRGRLRTRRSTTQYCLPQCLCQVHNALLLLAIIIIAPFRQALPVAQKGLSALSLNHLADVSHWKQRHFVAHNHGDFIQYSAYRIGANQVVVLGLGRLAAWEVRNVSACKWTPHNGRPTEGTPEKIRGEEHHDLEYHVVIFMCNLRRKGRSKFPPVGGTLTMQIDGEDLVVYEEKPTEVPVLRPKPPYLHNITHCSAPMHGQINAERIREWIEYHRHMGIDHFVLFDVGAIDSKLQAVLQPYVDAGLVEITDFRGVTDFESWYFGQVLVINECLYRFRLDSQWVMVLDFDEYLFVKNNRTLQDILEFFRMRVHLTHGGHNWSTKMCIAPEADQEEQQWPIERMYHRRSQPICGRDDLPTRKLCTSYFGHRKWFANPRRTFLVENHRIRRPRRGGQDLSTGILLHQHYQALLSADSQICLETEQKVRWKDGWSVDTCMAAAAKRIREYPENLHLYTERKNEWEADVAAAREKRMSKHS